MIVYLAGPMRGYPDFNFPAFTDAASRLRACGHLVVSPADHELEAGFDPSIGMYRSYNTSLLRDEVTPFDAERLKLALTWDAYQVLRAQAVVTLPGSEGSLGALAEVALAKAAGIPVTPLHVMLRECA